LLRGGVVGLQQTSHIECTCIISCFETDCTESKRLFISCMKTLLVVTWWRVYSVICLTIQLQAHKLSATFLHDFIYNSCRFKANSLLYYNHVFINEYNKNINKLNEVMSIISYISQSEQL